MYRETTHTRKHEMIGCTYHGWNACDWWKECESYAIVSSEITMILSRDSYSMIGRCINQRSNANSTYNLIWSHSNDRTVVRGSDLNIILTHLTRETIAYKMIQVLNWFLLCIWETILPVIVRSVLNVPEVGEIEVIEVTLHSVGRYRVGWMTVGTTWSQTLPLILSKEQFEGRTEATKKTSSNLKNSDERKQEKSPVNAQ